MRSTRKQGNQSLHVPSSRIRSHSLEPDKIRHKSSSVNALSVDDNKLEISTESSSPSWVLRRFTLLPFAQPVDEENRITTAHFSLYTDESYSVLLEQKRPSVMVQMMEVP